MEKFLALQRLKKRLHDKEECSSRQDDAEDGVEIFT
jgi:hypothetical protein